MASLDGMITISKSEYRPCIVDGKKALFHMWESFSKPIAADLHIGGSPAGVLSYVFAIIEFEDGTVDRALPQEVKFVDNKFKEYIWDESITSVSNSNR